MTPGSTRVFHLRTLPRPVVPCRSVLACLALIAALPTMAQSVAYLGGHSLDARWQLSDSTRHGTFLLIPYKPIYMLPMNWSSSPNTMPASEGDTVDVLPEPLPLDDIEFKFQLSFKTKVAQGLFNGKGDLWIAYTQSSRWQVYNADLSRPFRETNYEPEVMFSLPTDYRLLGMNGRLFTFGIAHQSNGRDAPLSRSWNRLIAQFGLERGRCTLLLRPWWRIPEDPDVDENPEIEEFLGNGELLFIYQHERHLISIQTRQSPFDDPFHGGSIQGDWSFTINGNLKAHLQVFHGYGESMLDYNHVQTTIGIGISLLEWL